MERVADIENIEQPLIKNIFKYYNLQEIVEMTSFSDIPSRTGLGGSSSYCVGLCYLINLLRNKLVDKKKIAKEAIHIERKLMGDAGGIQDQIWAAYGGLNTISIDPSGDFHVKPLAVTEEFSKHLNDSFVLIYTGDQRDTNDIAKSHENADKKHILEIAHQAHKSFLNENIQEIGKLVGESWREKRAISECVSNRKIDSMIEDLSSLGSYGSKLLGSGGCGFILTICDPSVKRTVLEKYGNAVLNFSFEKSGVEVIYDNKN
jgi:D-glycero-alpha-D-manno-heptose-7-phosphate kinase